MIFIIAAVFAMTDAQARDIANNSSKYSIAQVHAAVEQLRRPEPPDPPNPTPRYIAEHASHYSIFQVKEAIDKIKAGQGDQP